MAAEKAAQINAEQIPVCGDEQFRLAQFEEYKKARAVATCITEAAEAYGDRVAKELGVIVFGSSAKAYELAREGLAKLGASSHH